MTRIYLDNAATSWPKPDPVYEAVDHYLREIGANAGRGAYRSAQQAQQTVDSTRTACAKLLGIADPKQLIFTPNGTSALNLAIHGLLAPGDHVVSTVCEHNSVLRPLHWQAANHDVETSYVPCDEFGYVAPAAIKQAIKPNTKLVVVNHASNVTGAIQPISEFAKIVHHSQALLLIDAAQTAGCVPINVQELEVDMLACGGHKGLLAPPGTGLLYIRPGVEQHLRPTTQGGTGTNSAAVTQPDQLPEKFESGSLNLPALAGLNAAAKFLESQTVSHIQDHHHNLAQQLIDGLAAVPAIKVFGPPADQPRVAVVSCAVDGYGPQEFAAILDASCGIECRAGLHCAPQIHAALGTDQLGGLVRFSPGWSTTPDQIETALTAIATITSTLAH